MADISKINLPDGASYDIISKTGRGLVKAVMDNTTSSATNFIVSADNITALYDGLTIIVTNTKVASASGITLNLNNLGAKTIWLSLSAATLTTQWAINATYILTFDLTNDRWIMHQGYNTNTNTDTKVRQTLKDNTDNTNRPLLLAYSNNATTTANVDNVSYRNNSIYANPSTSTITATNFAGDASTVSGGHTVSTDVPSDAVFTDTTYTFTGGTNKFTVTPLGGTAQDVTVTPSITNNITGSGTSGYLTKFNGANTVTNGPQLGSSTTTYLRNDGTWATPTNTDTKVTQSATTTADWRKVVLGRQYGASGQAITETTDQVYVIPNFECQPSTGTVKMTKTMINNGVTLEYNTTTQSLDFIFA